MIKTGCCGFPVAQSRYMTAFPAVEINSSFYQLPRLETAQRWRENAPPEFEFTLKAWQLITHPPTSSTYRRLSEPIPERKKNRYGSFQHTPEVQKAWQATLAVADVLKASLILLQCPATFCATSDNVANVQRFFRSAPRGSARLGWEVRGAWPDSLIVQLCKNYNVIHVVDPLKSKPAHAPMNYFRLHGGYQGNKPLANHRYSDEELKKIRAACDKPLNYVFFNNIQMFDDARRFAKLISPSPLPERRVMARV